MNDTSTMSGQVRAFSFDFKGRAVRVVGTAESPLFVAADVCAALEVEWKGSGSMGPLDDDEKGVCDVNTLGGVQKMLCVTESGLYALIFKSRKEQAREFRKWVTAEVLPSLRKHGRYDMPAPADDAPARLIDALAALAESHVRLEGRVTQMEDFATTPRRQAQAGADELPYRFAGRRPSHRLADYLPALRRAAPNIGSRKGWCALHRQVAPAMPAGSFARLLAAATAHGLAVQCADGGYYAPAVAEVSS